MALSKSWNIGRGAAIAASLALAAAPAVAAPTVAPATEQVEGSELRGRSIYWALPLLIVIALLIAILAGDDDDTQPASP